MTEILEMVPRKDHVALASYVRRMESAILTHVQLVETLEMAPSKEHVTLASCVRRMEHAMWVRFKYL